MMIERLIETLQSARARKAMYVNPIDASAARNFLSGVNVACFAFGLHVSWEEREQATVDRGWQSGQPTGPIDEMRTRGLSEESIVDELFAIEIAALEMLR